MKPFEIRIRGRRYEISPKVLMLALICAGKDKKRAERGLLKVIATYDRYLRAKVIREKQN